jgi:hypothetical protein
MLHYGIILFILLLKGTDFNNLAGPVMSALALLLSSAAFIFTVIIQSKERKRNIRQTLSVALSEIARINVEVSGLKKEEKENSEEIMLIKKSYNSQRGTLVSDADFLIGQNKRLVTNADYALMALAYDGLGNKAKAEEYWQQAISSASTPAQKHINQRDYATFLFNHNQPEEGRDFFEKSLVIPVADTDDEQRYIADTYLIWAKLEGNFANNSEFERLIREAYAQCDKIRHIEKKTAMCRLIDQSVKTD